MLYYLSLLEDHVSVFRLFQYITVRTLGAAVTSFCIMLLITPPLIRFLLRLNVKEVERDERVEQVDKSNKIGTPTMGGLIILIATSVATLLWALPTSTYVQITLGTFLVMGLIGFIDDYLKIHRRNGLSVSSKFIAQLVWTVLIFAVLWQEAEMQTRLREFMVPFFKYPLFDLGMIGAFIFMFIVLVGASNAVNLTDGLDGLAIGCTNSVVGAYILLTYIAGHFNFAQYLQVPFVAGSGELCVFCGGLLGAGFGFLWFNCHPAKVFMGDTGLSLIHI